VFPDIADKQDELAAVFLNRIPLNLIEDSIDNPMAFDSVSIITFGQNVIDAPLPFTVGGATVSVSVFEDTEETILSTAFPDVSIMITLSLATTPSVEKLGLVVAPATVISFPDVLKAHRPEPIFAVTAKFIFALCAYVAPSKPVEYLASPTILTSDD